jgi:hypothetical protein
MKKRTPRTGLLLYLILNIIISAATTLGVLVVWDRAQHGQLPVLPTFLPTWTASAPVTADPASAGAQPTASAALPAGEALIEISRIVGATDPKLEYVLLKRVGAGDLNLAGWTLSNEHDAVFTFPEKPALLLYAGGAVQIFTRAGVDTPTEMFWNRTDAAWQPGEWASLKDAQGSTRARYQVP